MIERILFKPAVVCTDDDDENSSSEFEEDFSLSLQLQGLYAQYEELYVDFIRPREQEILEEVTEDHKRPTAFRNAVRHYVDNVKHALKRRDSFFDIVSAKTHSSENEQLFGLICELDNQIDPYLYIDIYGRSHVIYDDIALKQALEEFVRRAPTGFLCPYNEHVDDAKDLLRRVGELDMEADDDLEYCEYPFFTEGVLDNLKLMTGCTEAFLLKKVDEVEKYCADLIIEREEARRLQKLAEQKAARLELENEVLTQENAHLRGVVAVYEKQDRGIDNDLDLVKAKVEFLANSAGMFAKTATPDGQQKTMKPPTPEETSPPDSPDNSFGKVGVKFSPFESQTKRSLNFGDGGLVQ